MEQPRVTIGIPTLNRGPLALRAVRSALNQTYRNIEVLVSDDLSADDTVQLVSEIQDSRLVPAKQQTRLGLVANFDFCLRHASGEFFLLLGDDDVLLPNAIERLVEPFQQSANGPDPDSIGIVWAPCQIANAKNAHFWTTDPGPRIERPEDLLVALWSGNRGPRLSSILFRTKDAISIGGFEERYGDLCDLACWGKAALLRTWVACVDEPLVQYTNHPGSTTSQSAVRQWRSWADVVHADLVSSARAFSGELAAQKIQRAKGALISAITLTILIQTIGKPGWIWNGFSEAVRSPGALLTPYIARRLLKDGWKVRLALRASP